MLLIIKILAFCLIRFICLAFSPTLAFSGFEEWKEHIDAALKAYIASDYAVAKERYQAAIEEAEESGIDEITAIRRTRAEIAMPEQGAGSELPSLLSWSLTN